jgi:hypothetical protein
MNKLTAVEWLASNLDVTWEEKIIDLVERAIEMQKQQIIEAYNEGWSNHVALEFKSAERYYNELGLSEYDKHQEMKKGCTGPK